MSDAKQLAQDFMTALSSNDLARYEAVLSEDVGLRLNRWDGREVYRPRTRVMQRLMDEWSSWPDPTLEVVRCAGAQAIGWRWNSAFRPPRTIGTWNTTDRLS